MGNNLSVDENKKIVKNRYKVVERKDKGSYGDVYLVIDLKPNKDEPHK
jgi:hypothetical protein